MKHLFSIINYLLFFVVDKIGKKTIIVNLFELIIIIIILRRGEIKFKFN
jgi:hypothetical protein